MIEPFQQLEKEWAEWNGLDPSGMVACSSGTAALHLALESFKLPLGSECIIPDFTMIACGRAVSLAGLTPVFVDCDDRLLIDSELWKTVIAAETEAVIFVHIYGRRCQFPSQWDEYSPSLKVIEDLAEAHGIKPHQSTDAACWSFYRNKIVAGEEGGAVWFRDPVHAALARQLRSLGFTDAHDFRHVPRGHNYRMSNAHATLVLNSLDRFESNWNRRRETEAMLDRYCPQEWKMPSRDAPWVYDLRINGMTSEQQNAIVLALKDAGIQARHAFKPMSHQPEFAGCRSIGPERQWGSCMAAKEVIYLPLTPGSMNEADCKRAFEIIHSRLPSVPTCR